MKFAGLVDFKTLDKYWIEPSALGRRAKDWNDVYLPAGKASTFSFGRCSIKHFEWKNSLQKCKIPKVVHFSRDLKMLEGFFISITDEKTFKWN